MNIQKIKIDKLIPATYNPRKDLKPGDAEYIKIKNSIENFGYVSPLIINKDMTVIGGHQRLKVLKELGFTELECIIVDLDKTKEKALNIALNKIQGDWDEEKLEALLQELKLDDFDTNLTGFDFDEVDEILKDVTGSKEDNFDIDSAYEEIEEPITKPGDIWILGKHRLMCGDSTSEIDVRKLMSASGKEVKASIEYKTTEDKEYILTLKIDEGVEELTTYRKISFSIIWWSSSGLRIPNNAISTEERNGNEIAYVTRTRIGYEDKILVKVLKTNEKYSIVTNYTSDELTELGYSATEIRNMPNIAIYDEILIN